MSVIGSLLPPKGFPVPHEDAMHQVRLNDTELYFERGGPVYRLMHRVVGGWYPGRPLLPRILAFWLLTWFPLAIFALLEGRALGSTPRESFLLDFGTYARFFLGVPILIVAEVVIGPRLRKAGLHFLEGQYVRPEDYPAFQRAIDRVARWRESWVAEFVILCLALGGAWFLTGDTITGGSVATWRTIDQPGGVLGKSMTALWYHLIAVPILQFFWYRWLWRLFLWGSFLWSVSRLDLRLVPTHADQAGGLGFLGTAHLSFAILAFALSCVLSAQVAFLLHFENVPIDRFKVEFAVYLVCIEVFILAPLLCFAPVLSRTRLAWLRAYSLFVTRYNRAFHEKWMGENPAPAESLLGSADIQSLADLGSSFEFVRTMKLMPFSPRVMVQIAVVASLPCLPLLLLVFPVNQILELMAGAVF